MECWLPQQHGRSLTLPDCLPACLPACPCAAFAMDILDLAAQATIISGIAHGNFGMGVGVAAAMLVAADKASLATAAISCLSGISGELISAAHQEHAEEQGAAEAASADPAAPETEEKQ